jgi:uncharacterized protein (TIGR03000 family)
MIEKMMGKVVSGALVCMLSLASAGDAKAGWGSSGGSWGSSGGSWGSSGGSSGGSWGSSGGSWGSSGGSVGRWHAYRHTSVYSAGSWGSSGGSSGGSWGSSGGSWGSSGGSVGVVSSAYASPYVLRPTVDSMAARFGSTSRTPDSRSATLAVAVPADARVLINGRATTSIGTVRQFAAPGLASGKSYTYEVRAELDRNGQVVAQSQTVQLRAGETKNLVFDLERSREIQTSLTLQVPADATVVLAGEATTATGAVRTYRTSALNARQTWSGYTVQVSVVRNGREITQEKTIDLVGGQQTSLAFAFGDTRVATR